MLAYTYLGRERGGLTDKAEPVIMKDTDAIVRVTLASICTSDLHILHGSVPRAVPGITLGHEAVGIVQRVGAAVKKVRPGDRVSVNVETFCGECFFCGRGYVNNCTLPDGGWAMGCTIDGMQAELVRVPHADTGLTVIPEGVSDAGAVLAGDILATGWWAAKIADIEEGSDVLVIGAGPTGICCALAARLKSPKRVFMAGTAESFRLAWEAARPNATVTVVAMYDEPQILPLPEMYGKNLTFKTGGVDGCDAADILACIAEGRLNTAPLITHTFPLSRAEEAYEFFAAKADGVMKVALDCTR